MFLIFFKAENEEKLGKKYFSSERIKNSIAKSLQPTRGPWRWPC